MLRDKSSTFSREKRAYKTTISDTNLQQSVVSTLCGNCKQETTYRKQLRFQITKYKMQVAGKTQKKLVSSFYRLICFNNKKTSAALSSPGKTVAVNVVAVVVVEIERWEATEP